jgi:N-acetylmuramoyl-L-alanine amidase
MTSRCLTLFLVALACGGSICARAAEKKSAKPAEKKPAEANPDWKIVKYEGRDYLTLENIAHFYRLRGDLRPGDRRIVLTNGRTTLETGLDGRIVLINGVKQWLSFPVREQEGKLLVSRFDLAKTLDPALRPNMVTQVKPFKTVVIDAGHGGHDKGAASTLGLEKDYNLLVSRELKALLDKRGFKTVMVRNTDEFVPLEERARRANAVPDSIFVCIHFNASGDNSGDATGFGVFAFAPRGAPATHDEYTYADLLAQLPGHDSENASLALATAVQHALIGHMGEFDRGVKRARFAVLKLTKSASVLVEGGFLSNVQDGKQINDPLWRKSLCESIADGVEAYRGLALYRRPPKLVVDYRTELLPGAGHLVDVEEPSSTFPASEWVPTTMRTMPMPRLD